MKIEVGKEYKTRGGDLATVIYELSGNYKLFPFVVCIKHSDGEEQSITVTRQGRKWEHELSPDDLVSHADLTGAVLTHADLTGADLTGADLTGADLTGAVLTHADLTGADLTGAVLTHADLTGANLTGANLTGANLTGVKVADEVPVIPDIHKAVYAAASQDGALDMGAWHTCDTTHCRAGWVVSLAGEAGRALERAYGTPAAAALIYFASDPEMAGVPDFYCDNETAMADMKRIAEMEA